MDDLKLYGNSKDDLEILMNTARIFTDGIKMKFYISKCATFVLS